MGWQSGYVPVSYIGQVPQSGGVPVWPDGQVTVTVLLALALPPAPLQTRLYVLVVLKAPVFWLPLAGLLPLQAPKAVQPRSALVEDQVKVLLSPSATLEGEALRLTVGGAGGVTGGAEKADGVTVCSL